MALIRRTSTIRCDICETAEITLEHDVAYAADSGYPFNKAIEASDWDDLWVKKRQQYCHICPECLPKVKAKKGIRGVTNQCKCGCCDSCCPDEDLWK